MPEVFCVFMLTKAGSELASAVGRGMRVEDTDVKEGFFEVATPKPAYCDV